MSLRLDRLWLVAGLLPALFVAGESHALGLGEITLNSALNEPLDARIELVSATPEELANLEVTLASPETFARYGLYRPLFLSQIEFTILPSGRIDGNVVHVTSEAPVTEPFVTFLVEASWPRGHLLREYTVLLDPPVFAPPPVSEAAPAVTAPSRAEPADSGRIERAPVSAPTPARASAPQSEPAPAFDTEAGGTVHVQRGDTLWGIAERVNPDGRVSMNQTMLAIYEANPEAFEGNINRLNAGAVLRVPSADAIFRISRGEAVREVQQQNAAFGLEPQSEPRLTLVPPDEAPMDARGPGGSQVGTAPDAGAAARIAELEATIAEQESLIEVRDEELARLRAELERIRADAAAAEAAAPQPVADEAPAVAGEPEPAAADEPAPAEDLGQVFADDSPAAQPGSDPEATAEEPAAGEEAAPPPAATSRPIRRVADEPTLVDRVIDTVTGFWGILGVVLLVVLATLVWLARRAAGRVEEESTGVWDALDAGDDVDSESLASTERLRALARDDDSAIVVVEQEGTGGKAAPAALPADAIEMDDAAAQTGTQPSLEDTFSSETAINLDQSDPIAEADFHMAYGLYDQAADLINGALAVEPERQDLMAKLCEIYFVWGNRDSFVDAASRLHDQLGGEATPDWDKIVIMGRQIAADHRLFSGASAAGATRSVDLSLDSDEGAAELDMDFAGGPDGHVSDIVDLSDSGESKEQSGIDFLFDEDPDTGASTTREMPGRGDSDSTVESPTIESPATESTVETPTIEEPSRFSARRDSEETAEIDLDDLGLDLQELAASGLGDIDDDMDANYGDLGDLDPTTESGVLAANDDDEATGRNLRLDDEAVDSLSATSAMRSLDDATGRNPALRGDDVQSDTDVDLDVDATLLDATGQTQVLSDNDKTMLAGSLDDDQEYVATAALSNDDLDTDFDFAKTEALDKSVFDKDATGEMPSLSGDDIDLDLDDLTAALRMSEGDTVDQPRDEGTVERPRLKSADVVDLDFGDLMGGDGNDDAATAALSPDDLSDDLHEARTMTEVGTKLDLARAYVDMGDPDGARSILEEVLEEGDDGQRQQAQKLIDSLPA